MALGSGKHRQLKTARAKAQPSPGDHRRQVVRPRIAKLAKSASAHQSGKAKAGLLKLYKSDMGIDRYAAQIASATPFEIVEIERSGVPGVFIKDLSRRMEIPSTRIFKILGVPKATVEKKVASGKMIAGSGGQAAIGVAKLLALANEIVANSTAKEATNFDAAKWLGQWIERPQRSLGGRKPADLLDTPTGLDVVARLLGSAESGAFP